MNFLVPNRKKSHSIIPESFDNWFNSDTDNLWGLNIFSGKYVPEIDLTDEDDQYILRANLPGWNQNELELVVTDNYVTLQGNHQEEKDQKKKNYLCQECYHSSFKRAFSLNESVKSTEVRASLKNGILKAQIPKAKSKNDRKIIPIRVD
jgi:HSP20 family protein